MDQRDRYLLPRTQAVRWRIARRHLNRRRSHRLLWAVSFLCALLVILAGASGAGAYYFVQHLPSTKGFRIHYSFQNARIFDSRGDLLFNMADLSKNAGRRVVEPMQARKHPESPCASGINRIPLVLQNATIATEDATFYKNPGFDPLSIIRAAYQDLTSGRIVSGASTITQQVVRAEHLVNAQDRSLKRKADEVALAYEISRRFSKRQILGYYLNSVPYGNEAIGAQAAAQTYFHRQVCRLDIAQAALLAGLPEAPSYYDPVLHRSAAMDRMHEVLHLMRIHGYLRKAQVRAAEAESRRWQFSPPQVAMRYPQFVRYVINQIQSMPQLRSQLYSGIDIHTTLDPRLQDLAQQTVTKQIDGLTAQHVTDGALVSLDLRAPHYGWIMAMVGSAHYRGTAGQINMAVTPRQPGSSMKPFNYIYAFEHGAGPGTQVEDAPIQLPDPSNTQTHGWYVPTNYDHQWHGTITLRQALANSLNIPAIKVEYYLTNPVNVARDAYQLGMRSIYRDNPGLDCSVCYSVTLGGLAKGTRLLEETAAYGVFASGGRTVPPIAIWKVVKRSTHQVIYCSSDCPRGVQPDPAVARRQRQVVDPAHAYEMTNVLSDNNARCTPQVCEFGLTGPLVLDRPAAAKTGTTNNWTDNWTLGYTPQIVTGVWTGNADRSPMINVIGITGAAPIWHDYMEGAFHILNLPVDKFVAPHNVLQTSQCTLETPAYTTTSFATPGLAVPTPTSTPTTSANGIGVTDLMVAGDPPPLCRLPDRGGMPISCAQYPQPLPVGWQCLALVPGASTYGTYPSSGYPSTTYPSSTYPSNTYPSTTYPSTTYPSTTYTSTPYPSTTYPSTTYPSTTSPSTTYPSTTYPTTTIPSTVPGTPSPP